MATEFTYQPYDTTVTVESLSEAGSNMGTPLSGAMQAPAVVSHMALDAPQSLQPSNAYSGLVVNTTGTPGGSPGDSPTSSSLPYATTPTYEFPGYSLPVCTQPGVSPTHQGHNHVHSFAHAQHPQPVYGTATTAEPTYEYNHDQSSQETHSDTADTRSGSTSMSLSNAPTEIEGSDRYIILVQFKWGRQGEFKNAEPIEAGTHVIVSADRGRDLGMVTESRLAVPKDMENAFIQRIVRVAKQQEVQSWRSTSTEEKTARKIAQKVLAKAGITMKIVHAEYQFDMKKVTFHFASQNSHPDFRPVLDALFSLLRCRIWFSRYTNSELDRTNKLILARAGILVDGRRVNPEAVEEEEEEELSGLSDFELPAIPKKKNKHKKGKKQSSKGKNGKKPATPAQES